MPLILFLCLLASITEATRLDIGATTTIAGEKVTLVNIGDYGSIILAIGVQSRPLIIKQYGIPTIIGEFEIKIKRWEIEPDGAGFIDYELIKREIKCTIDSDCGDNNVCTSDSCDKRTGTCLNIGEECEFNGQCFSEATILNDSKKYCKENQWFVQKTSKEDCSNNHECLSNACLNNKCTGYLIGEETKGFLSKITGYSVKQGGNKKMEWLIFFFGIIILIKGIFFIIAPKKSKRFISSFSHYSNKFFKIFGSILIIVGFLLILVYLT